jgi:hypothetical protein
LFDSPTERTACRRERMQRLFCREVVDETDVVTGVVAY